VTCAVTPRGSRHGDEDRTLIGRRRGTQHDVITFSNAASIHIDDVLFVCPIRSPMSGEAERHPGMALRLARRIAIVGPVFRMSLRSSALQRCFRKGMCHAS